MPSLATSHSLFGDDLLTSPLNSWDDRRASIRRTLCELSWLNAIRVKYGPKLSLLDLSAGGAQIETSHWLKPGATVVLEIATESETIAVASRVLRAQVSRVLPSAATYRAALGFKCDLDLAVMSASAKQSGRELNLVHEHARLNAALRRLEQPMLQGDRVAAVGRRALAAALGTMESPEGRRSQATFSREMSRLFRIITMGLSDGTAPDLILDQMVDGVRRAVPAQVIRVAEQGSLVGIPRDAIYFDGLGPGVGRAPRLVVEFPGGCRLDPWHLSFLEAAAHLAAVIAEIGQVMGTRDRANASETTRDLPSGWRRLVVRYLDGRTLKGFNADFTPGKGDVHVWKAPNDPEASCTAVPLGQLKALFFVHDLEGDSSRGPGLDTWSEHGRPIEVTFVDGEVLTGKTLTYSARGPGFFVTPADASGNNVRLFVTAGAVRCVKFLEASGRGASRSAEDPAKSRCA